MKPPCEIVVNKILPAIRSILVRDLVEKHDLSQTEVAEKLGITQPAVSQYLKSVRGKSNIEEGLKKAELFEDVENLADEIASNSIDKPTLIEKYCNLCDQMSEKKVLCIFHGEDDPFFTENDCDACL